jgi:hypothetical protein
MKTSSKIEGSAQMQVALRQLGEAAQTEVRRAVEATAIEIRGDIVKRYQRDPVTGTTYYRIPGDKYMTIRAGGPDGPPVAFSAGGGKANLSLTHQASAPGEAPATDTGRLASATNYKMTGPMSAEVGNDVIYGKWLEFGTADGKIKPRPAWRPAVADATPKFNRRLEAALRKAMGL